MNEELKEDYKLSLDALIMELKKQNKQKRIDQYMLQFIVGVLVGGSLGVILMCLFTVGKDKQGVNLIYVSTSSGDFFI